MKKLSLTLAALVLATSVFAVLPVRAQETAPMTDDHIARIKNACPTTIATLDQLHANDGLVFVNRNQTYFSISDKLMARLNSRLALNRFDTTALVKIANEYSTALTKFRTAFKQYDETMADSIRMNCGKQPVGFYDKVTETRELRGTVNAAIKRLHVLIDQYRSEVTAFEEKHSAQLRRNAND